ncbi:MULTISPECIES: membrane protein insertase YidC [unclassified Pseudovibrio]|uniref:membrane protein insertase YidC n=1 Tax=unclassified Pseudovibrio TaxID=2627060 RepID=UPI00070DB902|nr:MULTISPECIES: membrane protein insertase YidC [unclassified Pseudovibrio]KZL01225.1 Membrane protein insertase YidC [Pseudovibrio sp. W74]KZL11290.1 Membrane protein insertase YidC [Pseudovibrio sp. Ad14]KZL28229.1 Membrane protein insertase YidC [Pseudovibrio sp. Ad37]
MNDNRNMIVAIVMSLVVLLGWQYFIAGPQLEAQQEAQQAQLADDAQQAGSSSPVALPEGASGQVAAPGTDSGTAAQSFVSRAQALAASPRLTIDTPSLSGSVNLQGAKLDDLRLNDYRQTQAKDSETVVLFSPKGSPEPYYAEHGWVADPGAQVKLPNAETVWTAETSGNLTPSSPIVLSWDNGEGLVFKRTFSVDENYMFTVDQEVQNSTGQNVQLYPYGLIARNGEPETAGFFVLHEGLIGVIGEEGLQEINYSDLIEDGSIRPGRANTGWLGFTDKYWAATLIPTPGTEFQPNFSYNARTQNFQSDYLGDAVQIADGTKITSSSLLYAGAKVTKLIEGYQASYNIESFDLMIDWGWFYFLTKPMFWAIDWLYSLVGNFGVAILLVTVIVKALFFPLANKSYVSMSKMKLVQPQMTEIREKFKDDKQKQQQAMMELYKKEKINPLAGCLPMVIQIPVFFSLYKVLFVTIEMRHAPFFGWIQDLSAPDPTTVFNLFGLIPWDPPSFLMIGVWPLIMGVTMFLQMKMNPAPAEPAQQMIFNWMPVLFTFMLATFPAGLVIYWAWNNTLSVAQQGIIMRRQGVKLELFDNLKSMFKRKPKEESK